MHTCCKWNLPRLGRRTVDHSMLSCCLRCSDPAQVTIQQWHVQYALCVSGSVQDYLLMHVLQPHRHHAPGLAGRFKAAKLWHPHLNLPAKLVHGVTGIQACTLGGAVAQIQNISLSTVNHNMQMLAAEGSSVLDCCDVQMPSFTMQTSDHAEGGITRRPSLQLVCGLIFRLILPQPGCPIGLVHGSWAGAEAAVACKLGAAGAAPTPAWSTCTPPTTSLAWPYQSELFLLGKSMV